MMLIGENKAYIDGLSYTELLSQWRYGAPGDPWFEGETGKYWEKRMAEKRDEDPAGVVRASKAIDR